MNHIFPVEAVEGGTECKGCSHGRFLLRYCKYFYHNITQCRKKQLLRIKMEDLATLLDDRRINVSRMLNELQAEGLVTLRRKEIEIPALEKLY